ncbi:MAG TPA: DMT family transporter [Chloroflexota bacterium]|nr:DMT family transporter [Chloroflexota bacterium]
MSARTPRAFLGPAAVSVAAMLWATDGFWRNTLIQTMPSGAIVVWEHVILVIATGWLLVRERRHIAALRPAEWLSVFLIGAGASGLATVLFTQAFSYATPTTVVLLHMTQPIFAISLASLMLPEPLPPRFWPLLPVALGGAYLIAFPDVSPFLSLGAGDRPLGVALALGAAVLWAAGTVLGRRMLAHVPYSTLTALRFASALPALLVIAALTGWGTPGPAELPPLLATALVSGLLGLLLYYWGLRDTPAAVATLCELWFPVTAIVVGALFLNTLPAPNQVIGIALLWIALALMRHRPVPATPETVGAALAPTPT